MRNQDQWIHPKECVVVSLSLTVLRRRRREVKAICSIQTVLCARSKGSGDNRRRYVRNQNIGSSLSDIIFVYYIEGFAVGQTFAVCTLPHHQAGQGLQDLLDSKRFVSEKPISERIFDLLVSWESRVYRGPQVK